MKDFSSYYLKTILAFSFLLLALGIFAQDTLVENVLLYQRNVGGWYKNQKTAYTKQLSPAEKADAIDSKFRNDATIDNNATTSEIRFLVNEYIKTKNENCLTAANNGIRYLLKMQYANGGFPQFYPDTSLYRSEITFNDNAMINVLNLLLDVALGLNNMNIVDASLKTPCGQAVLKGVDCILKTQIRVNGKLTAWCAQYDYKTFQPAKARSYELPSLSGEESVGVVEFLMRVAIDSHKENAITKSINAAIDWFKQSEIKGYGWMFVKDSTAPKGFDRILIKDAESIIWARFYDIETNDPFFCGRDGIKKKSVAEIEYERRTAYAWYGTWAKDLINKKYPEWLVKNN